MTKQHLTFRDIAALIEHGFDVTSHEDRPINVKTPTHMDFYDFERVEPNFPGSDRIVRVTFYPPENEQPAEWAVMWSDKDDDGYEYTNDYATWPDLKSLLADLAHIAWRPPVARLLELTRKYGVPEKVGTRIVFPNGSSALID